MGLAIYKELSHILSNLILLREKYCIMPTKDTKFKAGSSNFLYIFKCLKL